MDEEKLQKRKLYLDMAIIFFLVILVVTTSMLYFQTKKEGSQCLVDPLMYQAKAFNDSGTPLSCTCSVENTGLLFQFDANGKKPLNHYYDE